MRELYDVVNLRLVDVRKYNGVEDGCQSWTFLGYDVVKLDNAFSTTSILAEEETKYEVLRPMDKDKYPGYFDHEGLVVGDIRVKIVDRHRLEIFGMLPVVSKENIKKWIDKRPGFYFLHYHPQEENKVKKIGEKK
jgi:hypothetical protein